MNDYYEKLIIKYFNGKYNSDVNNLEIKLRQTRPNLEEELSIKCENDEFYINKQKTNPKSYFCIILKCQNPMQSLVNLYKEQATRLLLYEGIDDYRSLEDNSVLDYFISKVKLLSKKDLLFEMAYPSYFYYIYIYICPTRPHAFILSNYINSIKIGFSIYHGFLVDVIKHIIENSNLCTEIDIDD